MFLLDAVNQCWIKPVTTGGEHLRGVESMSVIYSTGTVWIFGGFMEGGEIPGQLWAF